MPSLQFVVLIVFGQDCLGLWLQTWTPCRVSHSNFELNGTTRAVVLDTPFGATFAVPGTSFSLIHHHDICGEQQLAPGRCSRFVIEGLGDLMLAKLAFTAFMTPALSLLLSLAKPKKNQLRSVRRQKQKMMRPRKRWTSRKVPNRNQ